MKRPNEMRTREHLVMTVLVLVVVGCLLAMGGCTQVTHSSDANWEYPV